MKKILHKYWLVFLAVYAVGMVLFSYLTGINICLVYSITGIPSPTCGMTRAWVFFLQGELYNAFFYHPLFWLVILFPLPIVIKRLKQRQHIFYISIMAVFIVVWVIRMATMFPHTPPMNFNLNALWLRFLR